MGWRGTLRSIAAAQRRAEREAKRRQRQLERQRKQLDKMREVEQAAYEVETYENYVELLQSVHKECSEVWDWEAIGCSEPPEEPRRLLEHEAAARKKLEQFQPGLVDKVLSRTESKREALLSAVEQAQQADEEEYQEALRRYNQDCGDWETACELAAGIAAGRAQACLDAIKLSDPFSEIDELGSSIEFDAQSISLIQATLHVNSEEVIPSQEKRLLKSGRLSVREMPKTRFYALYQDYVCSGVLRVARELFALLPAHMVLVHATGNLLNTKTGYIEETPILSVAIPRRTLELLNLDMLDPSDSMGNFVHRMAFKKTKGFEAVERLSPSDFETA
ncbi:MAG TPA: hypothetical protein VM537_13820 [Anaerolineae bacterium]|nr:hypothetical protein [Anaerolineae bacterium]